jgi:ABC-2 type transport system ATP-binding protein
MMKNQYAIETLGLSKRYDEEVLAVDGIDLAIATNSIYALLGPNGAGKTTTIAMLTTLIEPTAGTAKVSGLDVVKEASAVRSRIGVTFQEIVLDPDLTGRESLDFHGRLYKMSKARRESKINELLQLVELGDAAGRRTNTYSGGMKRRLELARGLMTEPDILFLDEPTQGLDPQNRANIWQYIRNLQANTDITILLTTHYMDEAEALADKVGIIDNGHFIAEGTPKEFIKQMGADVFQVEGSGNQELFMSQVKELPFVQDVNSNNGVMQINVREGSGRLVDIIKTSQASDFNVAEISLAKPTLGDVFLKYTGHQLRDK